MRLLALIALLCGGCAVDRYELRGPPERPFDVVIIPGCPSNEDGTVSPCQLSRALYAAIEWQRGHVRRFIASGAAVHNPYVEAEALAAAMAIAGVPRERIYLERDALHTDENMYFSLRIARALGARDVAVLSQRSHAAWGCEFLASWGQASCRSLTVDQDAVRRRHAELATALEGLHTSPVAGWLPLAERERQIARRTGRRRPPSYLLYPFLGYMRLNGQTWVPNAPRPTQVITWAEVVAGQ